MLLFVDNARDMLGMSSRDMLQASEYSHLERSFLSGLPNEIDFAMNVALLLSHDGRAVLSGGKGQKIVNCMLSCVGLFKDGKSFT
jgi:AT-rich interactive domain-containing protein 2